MAAGEMVQSQGACKKFNNSVVHNQQGQNLNLLRLKVVNVARKDKRGGEGTRHMEGWLSYTSRLWWNCNTEST